LKACGRGIKSKPIHPKAMPVVRRATAAFRAQLVASFVIDVAKSLNGLRLCDVGDDADMREYGGKRRHCVAGKFFGNSIIDFIEQ
jgi:hypothetical protein